MAFIPTLGDGVFWHIFIKKAIEGTKKFLGSDEWKHFNKEMKKRIDETKKKDQKKFKKLLPELKKEASEFCQQGDKNIGEEVGEKRTVHIDSLFTEIKGGNLEKNEIYIPLTIMFGVSLVIPLSVTIRFDTASKRKVGAHRAKDS